MVGLVRSIQSLPVAVQIATGATRSRLSPALRASREQHASYYRRLWDAAAGTVGARAVVSTDGVLTIELPHRTLRVRGTDCSIDPPQVLRRAADKVAVGRLLSDANLPIPPHVVVTLGALDPARSFLAAAPGPCVVKPARDSAAGRGVTTGLRTWRDVRRAAAAASAAGARSTMAAGSTARAHRLIAMARGLADVPLLVEHQVPGDNFRLLYLDGELIDAIRREPPTVVGDGRRTVAELLDAMNSDRLRAGGGRGQMLVDRDLDLDRTLAEQRLTLTSVPDIGDQVRLKTTINQNSPDANHPVRDLLCAELVEQGRTAAAVVGARLAGVDVLTTDPTVPLGESGGCVLEVNTTPGLAMHYHGREDAVDPAAAILSRVAARPWGGPA